MYDYETEKPGLMTDEGQRMVLSAHKAARGLLEDAGAFKIFAPLRNITYGNTWKGMAIIDRLVELGEIREVTTGVMGQDRVFVSA